MRSKTVVALVAVALSVAGIAAAFVLIDALWPWFRDEVWHPFRDNAEPWVAIGTILLAAATTLLAFLTRSEIRASLEEVAVSRQALQTNTRPLLVDAPLRTHMSPKERYTVSTAGVAAAPEMEDRAEVTVDGGPYSDNHDHFSYFTCTVPLQNVGTGLALIQRYELHWPDDVNWRNSVSQTGVRPGDLTRFSFLVDGLDPIEGQEMVYKIEQIGRFEVSVFYTDISGGQLTRSRIAVEGAGAAGPRRAWWRVISVDLYDGYDDEPFATLRREIVAIGVGQASDTDD